MWWMRAACLLHAVLAASADDYKDDYADDMNCLPQLADKCFSNVYADLECLFSPRPADYCSKSSADTLCKDMADSLQCASDEIDSSCKAEERYDFDGWLEGLNAIRRMLCTSNYRKLQALIDSSRCWNGIEFLSCVESEAKVGHVVDLLHNRLTWDICSRFILALATCNTRATSGAWSCRQPQGIVNDGIHAFFTNTDCGQKTCNLTKTSKGYRTTISIALATASQFILVSLRQLQ